MSLTFYGLNRKRLLINFFLILFQLRVVSQDVKFSPNVLDELYELFKVICYLHHFSNFHPNGGQNEECGIVLSEVKARFNIFFTSV